MANAQQQRNGQRKQAPNGKPPANAEPSIDELAEAIAYEEEIREAAEEIRGDASELTPALYRRLRVLARKPLHKAYIKHVPQVTGKPYASDGVRSVQVQMDRLGNVFGDDWWGYTRTYSDDGKLCEVTAWVGSDPDRPLVRRESFGGVDRGSTQGNLYKGSFTNAAKPAFARLGPGWEVYVGAADFDPDTDEAAAKEQGKATPAAQAPEPVEAMDGPELEVRSELLALAQEIVAQEVWSKRNLVAQLVAAGATDTSSVSAAIASMSRDHAEALGQKMVGLLSEKAAEPEAASS